MDKIQDGTAKNIFTIFSLSNLSALILFKKAKKNKWNGSYFYKLHGIYFVIKILEKIQQIFLIMIRNKLHDWCHWRTWDWSDVQSYTNFLSWCISNWLHKIGSCLTLHFLCCYANYLIWKQKVPCIMRISTFYRGKICEKKVHIIHG